MQDPVWLQACADGLGERCDSLESGGETMDIQLPQVDLFFYTDIVPKKNSFQAAVRNNGTPYTYKSSNARNSEQELKREAWVECARLGLKPFKGKVRVQALFARRKGDLIGVMETLQDALQEVVYEDDAQICEQHMKWDDDNALKKGVTAHVRVFFIR